MKLYVAYGSNLNIEQMSVRCPTAEKVGSTFIPGKLVFRRGVLTVEPAKAGRSVPVGIWMINDDDEAALDRYEGYPYLYRKEWINFYLDGALHSGIIYIMNDGRQVSAPHRSYFETVRQGYRDFRFEESTLLKAAHESGYFDAFDDFTD